MNCYQHHELSAVSQCKVCGRGLCPSCTDKYATPQCEGCKSGIKNEGKGKVIIELFLTILAGIIMYNLIVDGFFDNERHQQSKEPLNIIMWRTIMGAGTVSGWYIINSLKLFNKWIIFGNPIFWLISYLLKFFASMFVGFFLWPFRTLYNLWRLFK